jgi:hypothetical protein
METKSIEVLYPEGKRGLKLIPLKPMAEQEKTA